MQHRPLIEYGTTQCLLCYMTWASVEEVVISLQLVRRPDITGEMERRGVQFFQ